MQEGKKNVDGIGSHITISSKLKAESEKSGRGYNTISSTQMTAPLHNLRTLSQDNC